MDLTTMEEIDAPPQAVWDVLTDYPRFVRMARKRGNTVEDRTSDIGRPAWDVGFKFRGIERSARLEVAESEAPQRLRLTGDGGGILADITAVLAPLAGGRTALTLTVSMRGRTLVGRSLVQGLRIAHGTLQERFQKRVKDMVKQLSASA